MGNKSPAQVHRLGVRLIQAASLSRSKHTQVLDPFAVVKCEKSSSVTKAISKARARVTWAGVGCRPARTHTGTSSLPNKPCLTLLNRSPACAQSKDPYWDEFFVFEVRSPAFAVLRVKVMDHVSCWAPALIGEVRRW